MSKPSMHFNKVDNDIVEQLKNIVGKIDILKPAKSKLH